jgi:hypothetical protein
LFSKLKTKKNLKIVIFLKSKKNKTVNKINKFSNLLLEFSILFESKIILYCSCNIIAKFKLILIEFRNLLITLIVFDYLRKDKDRQVLLF